MMPPPAISVITPVWNGLPYIKECMESVLVQDFQDWEMLIGDNCSDDGTRDYLDSLADPRIRVFKHEQNLGIYGNLNRILPLARAPLVQILCADDYFTARDSLTKVIDTWKSLPRGTGFLRSNWDQANSSARCRLTRYAHRVLPHVISPSESDLIFYVFGCVAGNLSNVSFRTTLGSECGPFREDLPYSGDFEFWVRAGRKLGFAFSNEHVIHVRRHGGAASNYLNRVGELHEQNAVVLQELFARLNATHPQWLLRLHAAINYDTPARQKGLKVLLRYGSAVYLAAARKASRHHRMFPGEGVLWLTTFLTAGRRWGYVWPARLLMRNMQPVKPLTLPHVR